MRKFLLLVLVCMLPALALADVLGVPADENTAVLDLRSLTTLNEKQVGELISACKAMPALREVELHGVAVPRKMQEKLLRALPDVTFHWDVSLPGGATADGDAEHLDLDALLPASATLPDIRSILPLFPQLKSVSMYNFHFQFEKMEKLLADYPQVDFAWSIRWRVCSQRLLHVRTDATAVSTLKGRQDPRYTAEGAMKYLQYMPDLLAIDLGHNNVSDLSFLQNWPKLRRLIVVDSKKPITDLSPLSQLHDLEYVELFMQDITDISPLAGKTKLLDLNLCHNDVTDLSPLYSCTSLERLHISYNPHLTQEEVDKLQAALPNCVIETETYQSTGAGWRDHPRYAVVSQSFINMKYEPFGEYEAVSEGD